MSSFRAALSLLSSNRSRQKSLDAEPLKPGDVVQFHLDQDDLMKLVQVKAETLGRPLTPEEVHEVETLALQHYARSLRDNKLALFNLALGEHLLSVVNLIMTGHPLPGRSAHNLKAILFCALGALVITREMGIW